MDVTNVIPIRGNIKIILRDAATGRIKSVDEINNLVTTAGKNSIADGLRGDESNNQGIITYCALGSGSTAPALGDTTLETETFRKLISVRSNTNNQAIFETFFTTSEANGTHMEAGLFGDSATGTADTGTLFCRAAINRTKSSADTLTFQWTVIIG